LGLPTNGTESWLVVGAALEEGAGAATVREAAVEGEGLSVVG
jgi:hypothetical protein